MESRQHKVGAAQAIPEARIFKRASQKADIQRLIPHAAVGLTSKSEPAISHRSISRGGKGSYCTVGVKVLGAAHEVARSFVDICVVESLAPKFLR